MFCFRCYSTDDKKPKLGIIFLNNFLVLKIFINDKEIPTKILFQFAVNEFFCLGLADEILSAKIASEKKEEKTEEAGSEGKEENKKAEPMPRWQKFGYLFLGITMGGSIIGNAILFSMPDQDEQGNSVEVRSII